MPSDSTVLDRFAVIEGRLAVVENVLQFGNREFARIHETVSGIRDDLKKDMGQMREDLRRDITDVRREFRNFRWWIMAGLILFLGDIVKDAFLPMLQK